MRRQINRDFEAEGGSLPHYHGDVVRRLFVAIAALMMISIPFTGSLDPLLPSYAGASAIVLIVLAGVTNPRTGIVLLFDALAAGIGVLFTEMTAFSLYSAGMFLPFALVEVVAILFIFALYFSVKNVRSLTLHMIGKRYKPGRVEEEEA